MLRGDDSIEILGSPEMTLEVISPTSVEKDTVHLRRLYWKAGYLACLSLCLCVSVVQLRCYAGPHRKLPFLFRTLPL